MVDEPQLRTIPFDDKQLIRYKDDQTGEVRQYLVSDLLTLLFFLKGKENAIKRIVASYEEFSA